LWVSGKKFLNLLSKLPGVYMTNRNTQYGTADLHMHTTVSDGTMSPQAVVNDVIINNILAQKDHTRITLNVIAITDHDSIQGGLVANEYLKTYFEEEFPQIIIGAEVSSKAGHILGLCLTKNIPPRMNAEDTIDAIHEQGGIAIAAHPYAYIPFLKELKGIGKLIHDRRIAPKIDAVEIRNSNPTEVINNYISQMVNAVYYKKPVCGGSDSHFQSAIGRAYTKFPGSTRADLIKAIQRGTTRGYGNVYGPFAIYTYIKDRLAWKQFCIDDPIHRIYHDW
jgi:predicted metal-dependent phosphoesterase TrpH